MQIRRVTLELLVMQDEFQTPRDGKFTLGFSRSASAQDDAANMVLNGKTDLTRTEDVFTSSLRAELLGQQVTFDPVNFSVDVKVRSTGSGTPDIEIERHWRRALVAFLERYITQAQSTLASKQARNWFLEAMQPPASPRH